MNLKLILLGYAFIATSLICAKANGQEVTFTEKTPIASWSDVQVYKSTDNSLARTVKNEIIGFDYKSNDTLYLRLYSHFSPTTISRINAILSKKGAKEKDVNAILPIQPRELNISLSENDSVIFKKNLIPNADRITSCAIKLDPNVITRMKARPELFTIKIVEIFESTGTVFDNSTVESTVSLLSEVTEDIIGAKRNHDFSSDYFTREIVQKIEAQIFRNTKIDIRKSASNIERTLLIDAARKLISEKGGFDLVEIDKSTTNIFVWTSENGRQEIKPGSTTLQTLQSESVKNTKNAFRQITNIENLRVQRNEAKGDWYKRLQVSMAGSASVGLPGLDIGADLSGSYDSIDMGSRSKLDSLYESLKSSNSIDQIAEEYSRNYFKGNNEVRKVDPQKIGLYKISGSKLFSGSELITYKNILSKRKLDHPIINQSYNLSEIERYLQSIEDTHDTHIVQIKLGISGFHYLNNRASDARKTITDFSNDTIAEQKDSEFVHFLDPTTNRIEKVLDLEKCIPRNEYAKIKYGKIQSALFAPEIQTHDYRLVNMEFKVSKDKKSLSVIVEGRGDTPPMPKDTFTLGGRVYITVTSPK